MPFSTAGTNWSQVPLLTAVPCVSHPPEGRRVAWGLSGRLLFPLPVQRDSREVSGTKHMAFRQPM